MFLYHNSIVQTFTTNLSNAIHRCFILIVDQLEKSTWICYQYKTISLKTSVKKYDAYILFLFNGSPSRDTLNKYRSLDASRIHSFELLGNVWICCLSIISNCFDFPVWVTKSWSILRMVFLFVVLGNISCIKVSKQQLERSWKYSLRLLCTTVVVILSCAWISKLTINSLLSDRKCEDANKLANTDHLLSFFF